MTSKEAWSEAHKMKWEPIPSEGNYKVKCSTCGRREERPQSYCWSCYNRLAKDTDMSKDRPQVHELFNEDKVFTLMDRYDEDCEPGRLNYVIAYAIDYDSWICVGEGGWERYAHCREDDKGRPMVIVARLYDVTPAESKMASEMLMLAMSRRTEDR